LLNLGQHEHSSFYVYEPHDQKTKHLKKKRIMSTVVQPLQIN
jgi:hypothetical protein